MRHSIFVFAIVLHCLGAHAAEVVVANAKPEIVPTMKHLHEWCEARGTYDACTVFVQYGLAASCEVDGDRWKIHASAAFTPRILLYNLHELAHELDHIDDVRHYASTYLEHLEQRRFESAGDCRQKTLDAMGGFGDTMRGFALRSNMMRHRFAYSQASHQNGKN